MLWWTVNVESNTHVVCKLGVKNKIMHIFIDNSEIKQHLAVSPKTVFGGRVHRNSRLQHLITSAYTLSSHLNFFIGLADATICAEQSEVPRSRLEFDDRRMCILACHSICSCKTAQAQYCLVRYSVQCRVFFIRHRNTEIVYYINDI